MKTLILLALFVAGSALATVNANAGSCRSYGYTSHCAPKIYKVRTCEINRCSYKKWAYDHCGKRYSYRVTVITYKDIYSNGSHKIWKRTIS